MPDTELVELVNTHTAQMNTKYDSGAADSCSNPSRIKPKTLKMVFTAKVLDAYR